MGGVLAGAGSKLLDKWISLVALPGTLFVAVAVCARELGHRDALRPRILVSAAEETAKSEVLDGNPQRIAILLLFLASALGIAVVARGLGVLLERLWFAKHWPTWVPLLRNVEEWRVKARARAWRERARACLRAEAELAEASAETKADKSRLLSGLRAELDRICLEEPLHPNWCGDRIGVPHTRLHRDHGLDLDTVWPHLWLLLPEPTRTIVGEARRGVWDAVTLVVWGILYALLGFYWWPAALAGAVLCTIGWARVRNETETYARLIDAVVRLHIAELALKMGLEHQAVLDPDSGRQLMNSLGSSAPYWHLPFPEDGTVPDENERARTENEQARAKEDPVI